MKKEQVKQEILKITDWRHPYQLEPGMWVKLHRDWHKDWHLWRINSLMPVIKTIADIFLTNGLKGASILDTGCWDGFYGFEFLKTGAKDLLGVDLRDKAIARANLIKSYYGYENSDFQVGNIQDLSLGGKIFDISLMYGILYHLSSPIDVIKQMGERTHSMLLVNSYASTEPLPILKIKHEDPEKDSTGFQDLVTTPSEMALVEMLHFAGFDIVLRDYPFPFFDRYRNSDFGFFYGIKSATNPESIDAIFKELNVRKTYNPKLKQRQIVHLKEPGSYQFQHRQQKPFVKKLHNLIDKLL